jgi:hypothetical protein
VRQTGEAPSESVVTGRGGESLCDRYCVSLMHFLSMISMLCFPGRQTASALFDQASRTVQGSHNILMPQG